MNYTSVFLDIFFTSIFVYAFYYSFRGTRSETIAKGIIFIIIAYVFARMLNLSTIVWFFTKFFNEFPIMVVVIFHQEIRQFFSSLGQNRRSAESSESFSHVLAMSLQELSEQQLGALIVIERNVKLNDLLRNGVILDARFTKELIMTIFYKSTVLHDGAVIIRNEHIFAAKVLFPVEFHSSVTGARHGTAISVTTERDCIAFIVSEETGTISYAKGGVLTPIPTVVLEEVVHEVISQ